MPHQELIGGHTGPVFAVAVGRAGDRDLVVSGGHDATVRRWDAVNGVPIGDPLTGYQLVAAVAVGQAGDLDLIVGGGGGWGWAGQQPPRQRNPVALGRRYWRRHRRPVNRSHRRCDLGRAGPGGDRDLVVSGSFDWTVRRWDAVTGVAIGDPLTGHTDDVTSVALGRAGDRDLVVSGSFDWTVRRWDAVTGTPVGDPLTGHTGYVTSVALGRVGDRDLIVSGAEDETIRLWDAQTGFPVAIGDSLAPIVALDLSPDGSICAAAGNSVFFLS